MWVQLVPYGFMNLTEKPKQIDPKSPFAHKHDCVGKKIVFSVSLTPISVRAT